MSLARVEAYPEKRPLRILVAASFRSGSTHIGQTLCNLLDRDMNSCMLALNKGFGAGEHIIHPFMAQALFINDQWIFHMHCKGTAVHEELLSTYGFHIIVTTRNIYDLMLSAKERMDQGIYVPGVVSPPLWRDFTDQAKWEWMGKNIVPWHLQFAASWMMTDTNSLWVKYERYFADQVTSAKKILGFLGEDRFSEREIRKAADFNANLKVGKVGRGEAQVPGHVREEVEGQFETWGTLTSLLREVYH